MIIVSVVATAFLAFDVALAASWASIGNVVVPVDLLYGIGVASLFGLLLGLSAKAIARLAGSTRLGLIGKVIIALLLMQAMAAAVTAAENVAIPMRNGLFPGEAG